MTAVISEGLGISMPHYSSLFVSVISAVDCRHRPKAEAQKHP